jgi:hypothetical protein
MMPESTTDWFPVVDRVDDWSIQMSTVDSQTQSTNCRAFFLLPLISAPYPWRITPSRQSTTDIWSPGRRV